MPVAQRRVEIDVGGADQPEVHAHDPVAADRPVLALLQHPQQLGLEVGRHLADLVEQQRAPLGHLEQPFLVALRAGEGPLLVAEQLRLDQVLRDRGAVDLDERPLRPLAVVVDRVRDQLLAGAVLPLDQDVGVAAGDALHQLEHFVHLLALADDVAEAELPLELLLEQQVLADQVAPLDRALEHGEEGVGLDRLLDEAVRPRLHRLHGLRHAAVARDHDDFGVGMRLLELAEEFQPVDVRQHHVGDDDVGLPGLEDLLAAGADHRGPDLVALVLEQDLQPLDHGGLIVDREHPVLLLGYRHSENIRQSKRRERYTRQACTGKNYTHRLMTVRLLTVCRQ